MLSVIHKNDNSAFLISILSRIMEQINSKYCLSIYFLFLKKGGNSSEASVNNRNLHGTKKTFQVMICYLIMLRMLKMNGVSLFCSFCQTNPDLVSCGCQ